jgi:hypothetical protein
MVYRSAKPLEYAIKAARKESCTLNTQSATVAAMTANVVTALSHVIREWKTPDMPARITTVATNFSDIEFRMRLGHCVWLVSKGHTRSDAKRKRC